MTNRITILWLGSKVKPCCTIRLRCHTVSIIDCMAPSAHWPESLQWSAPANNRAICSIFPAGGCIENRGENVKPNVKLVTFELWTPIVKCAVFISVCSVLVSERLFTGWSYVFWMSLSGNVHFLRLEKILHMSSNMTIYHAFDWNVLHCFWGPLVRMPAVCRW